MLEMFEIHLFLPVWSGILLGAAVLVLAVGRCGERLRRY